MNSLLPTKDQFSKSQSLPRRSVGLWLLLLVRIILRGPIPVSGGYVKGEAVDTTANEAIGELVHVGIPASLCVSYDSIQYQWRFHNTGYISSCGILDVFEPHPYLLRTAGLGGKPSLGQATRYPARTRMSISTSRTHRIRRLVGPPLGAGVFRGIDDVLLVLRRLEVIEKGAAKNIAPSALSYTPSNNSREMFPTTMIVETVTGELKRTTQFQVGELNDKFSSTNIEG